MHSIFLISIIIRQIKFVHYVILKLGEIMKKYVGISLISILISVSFMYYFFNINDEKEIYGFLVGHFNDVDAAQIKANELPSSIILSNNDGYDVYVAMYENIDLINKMLVYYEEEKIPVEIKKLKCSSPFLIELNKYENIALKIENRDLYNEVNQNILDLYVSSI